MGRLSPTCFVLLQLCSTLAHAYHDRRYDRWYQPVVRRPVDIVTDVVNDLGVRILRQYPAHGNIAFSPTGVGFVLAALYEGSAGRGSLQIADVLGLPRDRDVTRIGFRDVHRRLRTYLNADGFLGGLTLSRANTKLRPEYEDVLRFYGFDLSDVEQEGDQTTTMPDTTTPELIKPDTTTPPTNEAKTTSSAVSAAEPAASSGPTTESANTIAPTSDTEPPRTTTDATVEIIGVTLSQPSDRLSQSGTPPPSIAPTSVADERSSSSANTIPVSTDEATTPTTLSSVTQTQSFATDTPVTGDSGSVTTANAETIAASAGSRESTKSADSAKPAGTSTETSELGETTISTVTDSSGDSVDAPISEETTTILSSTVRQESAATTTVSDTVTDALAAGPGNDESTVSTHPSIGETATVTSPSETETTGDPDPLVTDGTTPMEGASSIRDEATTVRQEFAATTTVSDTVTDALAAGPRSDKSTVPTDASIDETATVTSPGQTETTGDPDTPATEGTTPMEGASGIRDETTRRSTSTARRAANGIKKRSLGRLQGYFSGYPDEGIWMQDVGAWKTYPAGDETVSDSTEISFLVNGCDVSSVSATRYLAVLPFSYFPSLHAIALEFPLDDPRYNILLLMPTDRSDTYRLARDLAAKSLRLLRKQLQPTWVRATIPSFALRGFVTLTSHLQRLGIVDVFEPRTADLSPMTPDLGVYARDVQQSIGVNIRNYMKPDRTHSRNGLFERAGPVPFTALHPFLYFIVDAETSITLIAGRVDDPLNSRIL